MPMTPYQREKILRIVDGRNEILPVIYHWSMHRRSDQVWDWLLRNHLTGKNLCDWLQFNFGKKILAPLQEILRRIDNEPKTKPVLVGIDYLKKYYD